MKLSLSLRRGIVAAALSLAVVPGLQAVEVAGVRIDDSARAGSTDLVLNGAGLRARFMFKVYVAGLYLPKKAASAEAVLAGPGPRRIVLKMLRDVDADSFFGALRDGLNDNNAEAELAAVKASLAQLEKIFQAVGGAKSGDVIQLDFAAEGLAVSINGTARGLIADERFGKALLKVWLGDKPVDAGLKQALLGG